MVNVYTNNGQFNITESLMEAIKVNNPELLVEKKESPIDNDYKMFLSDMARDIILSKGYKYWSDLSNVEKESLKKNIMNQLEKDEEVYQMFINDEMDTVASKKAMSIYGKSKWDSFPKDKQKRLISKQRKSLDKEFSSKIDKDFNDEIYTHAMDRAKRVSDEIKIKKEKEEREKIDKEKESNKVVDANDLILLQQIIKLGGIDNLPDSLTIDGVKYEGEELKNEIDNRMNKNRDLKNAYQNWYETTTKEEKDKIKRDNKELETKKAELDDISKVFIPNTLEDLLNSQRLINEINSIEKNARVLIKKSEILIPRILGLFTKSSHNAGSDVSLNRFTKNYNSDIVNTNTNDNYNTNVQNVVNEDVVDDNSKTDKGNLWNGIKNGLTLATGGFVLEPLFNGSSKDIEKFGKAIHIYKSYTENNNNKSLIDDLMNYLILCHNNKSMFKEKINKQSPSSDIDELIKKLDEISANFLGNVVFSLKVGNDKNFNDIIRAIKFSELRDSYYISNESKVQILGAREQELIFKTKENVVTGIFVATPLLPVARELGKKAFGLMKNFRKAKA